MSHNPNLCWYFQFLYVENPLRDDNPLIQSGLSDLRSSIQIGTLQLPCFDEVLLYCGFQAIKFGYFLEPKLLAHVIDQSKLLGPCLNRLQYYCLSISRRKDSNYREWFWPISKTNFSTLPKPCSLDASAGMLLKSEADFIQSFDCDEQNELSTRFQQLFTPYYSNIDPFQCDYSHHEIITDIYGHHDPIQIATNPLKLNLEILPFLALICKADVKTDQGIIQAGTRRTRKSLATRHLVPTEAQGWHP